MTSSRSLTYVITGASRGLGLEFVKQLAATDSAIFALARNPNDAKNLQDLVKQNKNIHTVKMDQADEADEASIKAAAEEVAKLAPNGVDILINNAAGNSNVPVTNMTNNIISFFFFLQIAQEKNT
jgi:NAD(P)-dependent dehydrogenase (short-subunit alcohol dehydrogenase family)